ncbi:hypothetical protein SLA2020_440970, partial [Shorea laevis]
KKSTCNVRESDEQQPTDTRGCDFVGKQKRKAGLMLSDGLGNNTLRVECEVVGIKKSRIACKADLQAQDEEVAVADSQPHRTL